MSFAPPTLCAVCAATAPGFALQDNPRQRPALTLLLALAFALPGLACARAPESPGAPSGTGEGPAQPPPSWSDSQKDRLERLHVALASDPAEAPLTGMLVRLAFDGAADLDVFVTDPDQETVYFANTPSRSGGRLVTDRRCDDPDPRVEEVHFDSPPPGRYRVGVDFHKICDESPYSRRKSRQGLYLVRVDGAGPALWREGLVTPGRFEVIVLEFEIAPD